MMLASNRAAFKKPQLTKTRIKWLENTKIMTNKIGLLCLYSEIRLFKCFVKATYLKQIDVIQHYQSGAAIIINQAPKVFDCVWQRMLGNDEFSRLSVALQNTKHKWPVMNSHYASLSVPHVHYTQEIWGGCRQHGWWLVTWSCGGAAQTWGRGPCITNIYVCFSPEESDDFMFRAHV